MGGSLRTGAARYKQMTAHAKDRFCGAYLEFFQTYHKLAAQHLAAMNAWYNEAYKILHSQDNYSLEDLQAYLTTANGERLVSVLLVSQQEVGRLIGMQYQ